MHSTFLITFPVWAIFACRPTEQMLAQVARRPSLLLWNILVNDRPSPAFFTDQDQAEQFVKREIQRRPLTLMAFDHPADLMAFIYSLHLEPDEAVSFDPGKYSVHQARVADLEKVLLDHSHHGHPDLELE